MDDEDKLFAICSIALLFVGGLTCISYSFYRLYHLGNDYSLLDEDDIV